jgi:hypothetical protein
MCRPSESGTRASRGGQGRHTDLPQPAGGVEHLDRGHPRQERPPLAAGGACGAMAGSAVAGSTASTAEAPGWARSGRSWGGAVGAALGVQAGSGGGGEAGIVGGAFGAEGEEVVEHDAEEVELRPHPQLEMGWRVGGWAGGFRKRCWTGGWGVRMQRLAYSRYDTSMQPPHTAWGDCPPTYQAPTHWTATHLWSVRRI